MEVVNLEQAVILIALEFGSNIGDAGLFSERIRDHAVAGLEADLRLEGVLTDCTEHL